MSFWVDIIRLIRLGKYSIHSRPIHAPTHAYDHSRAKDDVIWQRICNGEWSFNDRLWQKISKEAKDLLQSMLVVDASSRLTMQQVCEHEWFMKMHLLSKESLNTPARGEGLRELGFEAGLSRMELEEDEYKMKNGNGHANGSLYGVLQNV